MSLQILDKFEELGLVPKEKAERIRKAYKHTPPGMWREPKKAEDDKFEKALDRFVKTIFEEKND